MNTSDLQPEAGHRSLYIESLIISNFCHNLYRLALDRKCLVYLARYSIVDVGFEKNKQLQRALYIDLNDAYFV